MAHQVENQAELVPDFSLFVARGAARGRVCDAVLKCLRHTYTHIPHHHTCLMHTEDTFVSLSLSWRPFCKKCHIQPILGNGTVAWGGHVLPAPFKNASCNECN